MNKPAEAQLETLLHFLREERGFDFTGYKRPTLSRRVARRMQTVGIDEYDGYQAYLEAHPEEFGQLFNTVLINVTSFFRDPHAWQFLGREIVPRILSAKGPDSPLRFWSAGCASGEEAYSLAIVLAEALGPEAFTARVKIYGTDLDEEALNQARHAAYPAKKLEAIEPGLRKRYFEPVNSNFAFRADLRRSLVFGRHDLMQDSPISRLDLLVCRNTLMYFNLEAQRGILSRFHFALNGDGHGNGYLFLGRAEMLLTHSAIFAPLDRRCRIFAKVPSRWQQESGAAPVPEAAALMSRADQLRDLALDDATVARIVIDADGLIVLINQRARVLFSLTPRDMGRPLKDLEVSYRPVELRSMIEQAHAERRAVVQTSVERRFSSGEMQYLDVVVWPLHDDKQGPIGTSISFVDVTHYSRMQEDLRKSREEVESANEELQSSNEELETTNEELQSSNEELETTNEELQSTNEELETMNEELQSTNEELQTVNEELRQRTDELHHSNSFLESVLGSLPGAAVVVNQDFNILVWNYRAEDMWGLRPAEVEGRSFLNLDIGLPVGELRAPVRACLTGETDRRVVTLDAVNRRGKTFKCRVTCTPLLGRSQTRDGVILLMEEA